MLRLRHLAHIVGSPTTLVASVLIVFTGFFFDFSEEWWTWLDRCVYLVTLWAAFIVQAAQNRDTEAMQRKLDGIIHASTRLTTGYRESSAMTTKNRVFRPNLSTFTARH